MDSLELVLSDGRLEDKDIVELTFKIMSPSNFDSLFAILIMNSKISVVNILMEALDEDLVSQFLPEVFLQTLKMDQLKISLALF